MGNRCWRVVVRIVSVLACTVTISWIQFTSQNCKLFNSLTAIVVTIITLFGAGVTVGSNGIYSMYAVKYNNYLDSSASSRLSIFRL